jgi:hypothetical protein
MIPLIYLQGVSVRRLLIRTFVLLVSRKAFKDELPSEPESISLKGEGKMSENEGKGKLKNAPGRKRTGFFARSVEFSFQSPEAKEVFLAGDFNGWDTGNVPLKKGERGVWKTKLKLPAGRYEYKFFKDGSWVQDVAGMESVPNIYGTRNFVVEVL